MTEKMIVVRGGGLSFLTADPCLIAAMRRCAQLETELREARYQEVARFRTLRSDVRTIKKDMRAAAGRRALEESR